MKIGLAEIQCRPSPLIPVALSSGGRNLQLTSSPQAEPRTESLLLEFKKTGETEEAEEATLGDIEEMLKFLKIPE